MFAIIKFFAIAEAAFIGINKSIIEFQFNESYLNQLIELITKIKKRKKKRNFN